MRISQTIRVAVILSLAFAVMASSSIAAIVFVLSIIWPKFASIFGGAWGAAVEVGVLSGALGLMVGCTSSLALLLAAKPSPTIPGNASLRRSVTLTASVTVAVPILAVLASSSNNRSVFWWIVLTCFVLSSSYRTGKTVPKWTGRILRKIRDPDLVEIGTRLHPEAVVTPSQDT